MKNLLSLILLLMLIVGCDSITEKAKNTINKTGEKVGQTATEFIEGVSEGVEKSLETQVVLSDSLNKKGLGLGASSVENDTIGSNNKLVVYFIFNQAFNDTVIAKVYNKNNVEIGRSKLLVTGAKKDAKYVDFIFDKRTYIEVKSTVVLDY